MAIGKLATDRHFPVRADMKKEATHQTKLQCLGLSKVCAEEAIQKGSIKAMLGIETLDTFHYDSLLVVCENLHRAMLQTV